jgi:cytochrome b
MKPTQATIKVWDPVVRIGHWTLVLAFFVAYFTEDDFMTQHVWAGYVVGAVVCFRLLWGFVGTEHARFKDFVVSPATMLQYVRDLRNKRSKRYIGHNPIGGAMIIALLISVAVTVYTGVALYAIEDHAGPLAAWFAPESAVSEPAGKMESSAESDERKGNAVARQEDPP